MHREDLGNGAEFVDYPFIGIMSRKLTDKNWEKLELHLRDAPAKHGLSGKQRLVLYHLASSGIDANNLAALTWADISLADHKVRTKSASVLIPKELSVHLEEMRGATAGNGGKRVFPELRGLENPASVINTMFQSDCLKAQLDLPTQQSICDGPDEN